MFKESMPMRPEQIEKKDLGHDILRQEFAKEARRPYHGSYFAKMEILALALALFLSLFPTKKAAPAESSVPAAAHELKKDANIQKEAKGLAQRLEQRMAEKGFKVEVSLAQQEQTEREVAVVDLEKGVKDAYEEVLKKAQEAKSFYREVSFITPDGKELPLEKFVDGLGIKIDKGIYDNLSQTEYKAVFCHQDKDRIAKGLILKTKGGSDEYYQNLFANIASFLRGWETSIFADLGSVFYSESEIKGVPGFRQAVHHDKYKFMNLHRREASTKDAVGNDCYLGHIFFGERLFVANDRDCLQKMTDVYSPEPG